MVHTAWDISLASACLDSPESLNPGKRVGQSSFNFALRLVFLGYVITFQGPSLLYLSVFIGFDRVCRIPYQLFVMRPSYIYNFLTQVLVPTD